MSDENPYLPPASLGDSAANGPAFWYTEGKTIYVLDGAILPAIDLETGEVSNLIKVRRKFAVAGATIMIWGMAPALFSMFSKEWRHLVRITGDNLYILLAAVVMLFILHTYIALSRPSLLGKCVRFTTHRNAEQERKRRQRKILLITWFCLSLLGPVGLLLFFILDIHPIAVSSLSIITFIAISVVSMVGAAIWQWFHQPQIRLEDLSGKWLRVKGACDEALAHLRNIESERSSHRAA